ncbi:PAS domain-containing protein [Halomicroarcula sp. GCM10025709]|uniref:PAS domain-containing protein n=1 Tax=Halomicroarcula sp. GCM10025709 TaxID=3252669 RepID=UPI00362192AD
MFVREQGVGGRGCRRDRSPGTPLGELFLTPAGVEAVRTAAETGQPQTFQWHREETATEYTARVHPGPDGVSVVFTPTSAAVPDESDVEPAPSGDGNAEHGYTETDRTKQRLERNQRRFEAVLNDPQLLVGIVEPDGTTDHVNEAALARVDADREAVEGEPFPETPWWNHDEDLVEDVTEWLDRAAEGEYVEFDAVHPGQDDGEVVVTGTVRPVVDDTGEVESLIVSARDITERRSREVQLEEAEQRLDAIVQNTSEAIFIKEATGEYRFINEVGADVFGLEPEAVVGKTDEELFEAPSAAAIRRDDSAVMAAGTPSTMEVVRYVDGEKHVFIDNKFPYRDETGEVVGLMGVSRDITERKDREQELEATKNTLAAVVESAPNPIVMLDSDHRVTLWNESATQVFGWTADAVVGEPAPFVPEQRRPQFERILDSVDEQGTIHSTETVCRANDGDRIDVSLSLTTVETSEGTEYLAILEDIRERKSYQRAIEALHDATRDLIDADSRREAAERTVDAANELLGFEAPTVWVPTESHDGLELAAHSDTLAPHLPDDPVTHDRGDWLWELYEQEEIEILDTLQRDEIAPNRPLGSAIFVPLGSYGILSCAALEQRTITDDQRYLAETLGQNATTVLQSLDRKATLKDQRNDLEMLDQMVRHDIRNDLQAVFGYADALKPRVDEGTQETLDRILANTESAVELTRSARELAEVMLQDDATADPIPLRRTLRGQLDNVQRAHSNVEVSIEESIPGIHVRANEMLPSVFRNLLTNAVQHNDKETVEIDVAATERSDSVVVEVADNGTGIDETRKDTITDEGETGLDSTGTGIGLYLVQTLLDTYGGDLRIDDNEPEGSVFTVELPKAESATP